MANAIIDVKSWTQHERVVYFRALSMGMSVRAYARKFKAKNLPHLVPKK